MLVSVVMAAYNAEAFVAEAVESVLNQSHQEWELLVVDDGSHDQTRDVVRAFDDPRIRLIEGRHVGVLGAVRNTGVDAARGDIVALLDADDVWLPEKLERQVACFRERAEVGVVHTGTFLLAGDERRPFPPPPRDALLRALVDNNFIVSSSAAMRRTLLDEHGAFDQDPALRGSPDYELWLRLAPVTEFAFVPEPLVLYRQHGAQMTADLAEMSAGGLAALDKARERWGKRFPRAPRRYGVLALLAGDRSRARKELISAVVRRPWDVRAWVWLLRTQRNR